MKYHKYFIDFQEPKAWATVLKFRDEEGGERDMREKLFQHEL